MTYRQKGRAWRDFPFDYYELLHAFESSACELHAIECGVNKKALRTRFDLYHFFNALRAKLNEFDREGDKTSELAIECYNLVELANTVTLLVEGTKLVAERRPFYMPRLRKYVDPQQIKATEQLVREATRKSYKDSLDG